ncbi:MAG: cupin domain-containing protein [Bacteroidetes bacterium]|jgi:transcriptional regulator with XRE-family HTH domain|nr:cupin domain-containing protein [Bacteroidota bacterium]
MKRLGERIKRKREGLQMHLSDLAKQVGISVSALSQIENAKAFPSIFSLKAIADSLHCTVGELIGEFETLSQNPKIKAEERKFVKQNNSGTKLYLLSHHDPYKQMETYAMILNRGSGAEDLMIQHPGQEFVYVTEGQVKIQLDEKAYFLVQGDSFYFNSNVPHTLTNDWENKSMVLWIITPHI